MLLLYLTVFNASFYIELFSWFHGFSKPVPMWRWSAVHTLGLKKCSLQIYWMSRTLRLCFIFYGKKLFSNYAAYNLAIEVFLRMKSSTEFKYILSTHQRTAHFISLDQ